MANFTRLPLIVGFGGFNAAGRSSGHNAYKRMIFESLGDGEQRHVTKSLASLMGLIDCREAMSQAALGLDEAHFRDLMPQVLTGTLVRQIEASLFDTAKVAIGHACRLVASEQQPATLRMSARDLPSPLPSGWTLKSARGGQVELDIRNEQTLTVEADQALSVGAAGQLPSGFNPANYYRSTHHPRGLQLNILAASDAVHSMGVSWHQVLQKIAPDQVGVYSSSVMSQLDSSGFGGMMQARNKGNRVTSKQLALGLNTMPADFVNAYVLGSVGVTGGVTGACATFLYNLRAGVEDIQSGRRRVVLVGSSEAPILPEIIDGYAAMSALATDADLRKLTGQSEVDYRRASRPFGENCGFTLAESGQYAVLMDDQLALELGANIFAAVPGVFVHADGYKKSISAPGPGNYITMAKAVALAQAMLGTHAVRQQSFVQAHGSSTPQNRVTESRILDRIAQAFAIDSWPVAAVKAYVGHSLGPAGGDQLATTLGVFDRGILPGIKTIDKVAEDVQQQRLQIRSSDIELDVQNCRVAFLNSKGFGGNNATATVLSPAVAAAMLRRKCGDQQWNQYLLRQEATRAASAEYEQRASCGVLNPIYEFGSKLIDEDSIIITQDSIKLPGFERSIPLPACADVGEWQLDANE